MKHKVHGVISSRWLKPLHVGLMVYKVGSLSHEAKSKEMLSSCREPTRIAMVVVRFCCSMPRKRRNNKSSGSCGLGPRRNKTKTNRVGLGKIVRPKCQKKKKYSGLMGVIRPK